MSPEPTGEFSAAERTAMKQRAAELKAGGRKAGAAEKARIAALIRKAAAGR